MAAKKPGTRLEQRYGPTSGTASGWFGLVMCAAVAIAFVVSTPDVVSTRWALLFVAFGLVIWSMMLRPLIIVRAGEVVLRNPFASWRIPLALVEGVTVRAVTWIETPGKTYSSAAVGRRLRRMTRRPRAALGGFGGSLVQSDPMPEPASKRIDASTPEALADLMIGQILAGAAEARRVAAGRAPEPVGRTWAVPELVLLGATLVALAITLVI